MTRIEVDHLSVTFGSDSDGDGVPALEGVSFSVQSGEFTSIVGPSGCGKTTMLRVMSGALTPSRGTVVLDGSSGRGTVFQEDSLLPWRTVLDNVAFGLEVRGVGKHERHRIAREYLDLVGLDRFHDRYPYELSGGMKQRANLARALAIEPAVLLMDEPFASLDSQTREVMQEELLRIWQRTQKTVVFVTHQIDEAVYLSDRVVVLSGRPGTVKANLLIQMDRPRSLDVKRTMGFVADVDRIWKLLESDLRPRSSPPPGDMNT